MIDRQKEILDWFGDFRLELVEKLKELVRVNYNGRVELAGHIKHEINSADEVQTVSYDCLVIRAGVLYVDYSYCSGWELGEDTEHIEDEVDKFSADEIYNMICDIQ